MALFHYCTDLIYVYLIMLCSIYNLILLINRKEKIARCLGLVISNISMIKEECNMSEVGKL